MAKPLVDYSNSHHQPRKIDKKKKSKVFNEETTLENRGGRVSFKNYLNQVREEEAEKEFDANEWIVEEEISYHNNDVHEIFKSEVEICLNEEEARRTMEELQEQNPDIRYSIRPL